MKTLAALALLAAAGLAAHGQTITVTPNVLTTGGVLTTTMPGDADDFIVFNAGDYTNFQVPNLPTNVSTPEANYNELSSFFIAGGLQTSSYGTSITSPANASLTNVGALQAGNSHFAFALRPGSETANDNQYGGNGDNASVPPVGLNPNFNYNDFNVYIFFSDIGGDNPARDINLSLDVRVNGSLTQGLNPIAVVDDNTTSGDIKYVEYNVTGLGTALADGENADLVVDGNSSTAVSYVNAISFQSIPEPSTVTMMLAGGLGLLLAVRRVRARLGA